MQNLSYSIKYSTVPISSSLGTPSSVPMTHIYNGKNYSLSFIMLQQSSTVFVELQQGVINR